MPEEKSIAGKPSVSTSAPAPSPEQQLASDAISKGKDAKEEKLGYAVCRLTATIERGDARVFKAEGPCAETINNLPPMKQAYWKRRMTNWLQRQLMSGSIEISLRPHTSETVSGPETQENVAEDTVLPRKRCLLKIDLGRDGHLKVKDAEGDCRKALGQLSPARRDFWLRKMPKDLRQRLTQSEEQAEPVPETP